MNITPETKPISEIFPIEGDITYRIPIYQRNYSWQVQNIDELFNDIMGEEKGYYVGNLLVSKVQNDKNTLDIVDGQQRLTTIALFLLALYEILNKLLEDNEQNQEEIYGLKLDIKRKLIKSDGKPRLSLLTNDAEVFKSYLGVMDKKEKGRYGNRMFGKRYSYIQDTLSEQLNTFQKCNLFYEKINSVEVLRITVNDLSDAFSVFSSINAKGLPLTLIDLLKSSYLSKARSELSDDEAIENWDKLINIFNDDNKDPNSRLITQFLLNNYDTFISEDLSSITKSSALKKYTKLFEDKGHHFIDDLINNAKYFSAISSNLVTVESLNITSGIEKQLERLYKLEISQAYPLLLYLFKEYFTGKLSEEYLCEVMDYITRFYVRRNIILKPKSSNIRAKIIEIVRKLKDEKIGDPYKIVHETLGQIAASDEEFFNSLKSSVYDISPKTVRFILIDIERSNITESKIFNKQNPDNLDDYIQKKKGRDTHIWTLEHILPQGNNLPAEWAVMISPEDMDKAKILQQENMHKLGNLTLTGYNSELSNSDFITKRDYKDEKNMFVGLRTDLFLNKSISSDDIDNKNEWTISDINKRTEILANIALELYKL